MSNLYSKLNLSPKYPLSCLAHFTAPNTSCLFPFSTLNSHTCTVSGCLCVCLAWVAVVLIKVKLLLLWWAELSWAVIWATNHKAHKLWIVAQAKARGVYLILTYEHFLHTIDGYLLRWLRSDSRRDGNASCYNQMLIDLEQLVVKIISISRGKLHSAQNVS